MDNWFHPRGEVISRYDLPRLPARPAGAVVPLSKAESTPALLIR